LTTTDIRVPASLAALDASWFTDRLRAAGVMQGAVRAVSFSPLAIAGAAGALARAELQYDAPETAGPRSLIVKGAGESENQQVMDAAMGLSAREQLFYSQIAPVIPVATPRCFFADEVGGRQPLLLEDLAHLRAGDQVTGLALADAERLVDLLADLHARYWGAELPGGDPDRLISWTDPAIAGMLTALICSGVSTLRERYAGRVPDGILDDVAAAAPEWAAVLARCAEGPQTFVHNDFRLDNIFFDADGEPVVIDWQLAGRSRGTQDLAYLLSGSMTIDSLRTSWSDLVGRYHARLLANGVTGYGLEECTRHYRQSLLYTVAPGVAMLGQMQVIGDDRGLADALVLRTLVHAGELDAFGTL
jgi:aminoglycoside/choline kinase family phosphotransferase